MKSVFGDFESLNLSTGVLVEAGKPIIKVGSYLLPSVVQKMNRRGIGSEKSW